MKKIKLENSNMHEGNLILINGGNPIEEKICGKRYRPCIHRLLGSEYPVGLSGSKRVVPSKE